ncbi:hypothetical protein GYB57_07955 [bacterium]|nr:hypothetical protein [bacterium]
MKKYLFYSLTFFMLIACNNKKKVVEETTLPKPSWISDRPITDMYYIGIGSATMEEGTNFIESAKNNALNDLASEIKVSLESNTVYYQNESNKTFNEDFRSTIKTSIAADLEGYSLIDSWQGQNKYWVYYRLSKAEYFEQVERKRLAAKKAGEEFYRLGIEAAEKGDVILSINHYFDAISAIKNYGPSAIEVLSGGQFVFLDHLIMSALQSLLVDIEIDNSERPAALSYFNGFKTYYPLLIKRKGKIITGLPLESTYFNQYGEITEQYVTNEYGKANVSLAATDIKVPNVSNVVKVNIFAIAKNRVDAEFLNAKLANLVYPRMELIVNVERPKLFVDATEKEFGKRRSGEQLSGILVSELVKEGIQIVDKREKADLLLELVSDTKFQSKDENFTVVVLNYNINLSEVKSKKSIYSGADGPIKGVNLDEARASVKAYEKAEAEMYRKLVPKLKEAIL